MTSKVEELVIDIDIALLSVAEALPSALRVALNVPDACFGMFNVAENETGTELFAITVFDGSVQVPILVVLPLKVTVVELKSPEYVTLNVTATTEL